MGGLVPIAVRQPISIEDRPRRHLDERTALRFPRAARFLAAAVWRLSPQSRVRRRLLGRYVRMLFEAFNRGDYDATFILYHPDGETIYPPQFVSVGFESYTRGRAERIRVQRRWNADWGEFYNRPQELIDLGDRVVLLARLEGSGFSSGALVDSEVAYLLDMSGGYAVRERIILDHREALEAVGLRYC